MSKGEPKNDKQAVLFLLTWDDKGDPIRVTITGNWNEVKKKADAQVKEWGKKWES